jgi:hypothetical protein
MKIRGRREDRVRAAPAVSRAIVATRTCTRAYRFSGNTPAFPAQWLYGLYEIVLVIGFLATIVSFSFRFRQLDASTGASDPNDFTVRNSPFVSRAAASTAPCPSFATMAYAPWWDRMAGVLNLICPTRPAEYFCAEGWTDFGDLPVGLLCRRHLSLRAQENQGMRGRHRAALFDHLVGSEQQLCWHSKAECFGGLQVNHQIEFTRLHNW